MSSSLPLQALEASAFSQQEGMCSSNEHQYQHQSTTTNIHSFFSSSKGKEQAETGTELFKADAAIEVDANAIPACKDDTDMKIWEAAIAALEEQDKALPTGCNAEKMRAIAEHKKMSSSTRKWEPSALAASVPRLAGLVQACDSVVELDVHRLSAGVLRKQTSPVPGCDLSLRCCKRRSELKVPATETGLPGAKQEDAGLRPGDTGLRPGGTGLRPGTEGLRPGQCCEWERKPHVS